MKTLLVSATVLEVAPTLRKFFPGQELPAGAGSPGTIFESEEIDCLVTGVGQMLCAAYLAKRLSQVSYGAAIQAGLAGSFSPELPKLSVALVGEECLADLGAEGRSGFLDLFEMGLLSPDSPPFEAGRLVAPSLPWRCLEGLPRVRSLTVNRVLSHAGSIAWAVERYQPQLVNMEGAAFLFCCLEAGIPCLSLRSVSDLVGPRDKSSWDIPGAVAALNVTLDRVLCREAGQGKRLAEML